ncbi:hypothetical protein BD779DRAFT_1550696 [Infundibulicybe gibba]|nr:hypothetical protein BD779DRAFT_1550696 [Infundibulicybe gibba]
MVWMIWSSRGAQVCSGRFPLFFSFFYFLFPPPLPSFPWASQYVPGVSHRSSRGNQVRVRSYPVNACVKIFLSYHPHRSFPCNFKNLFLHFQCSFVIIWEFVPKLPSQRKAY